MKPQTQNLYHNGQLTQNHCLRVSLQNKMSHSFIKVLPHLANECLQYCYNFHYSYH